MSEQAAPAAPDERARMSARRAVALTLGSVLAVAALAGAGVGVYLLYNHQANQTSKYKAEASQLQGQLLTARADADTSYRRGFSAGQSFNAKLGLTYPKGYKAGYAAAFSGFGGWIDGSWYLVKIGRTSSNQLQISSRALVTPCQRTFIENDAIYTQGYAC
jgi:hypothetical protein